MEPQTDRPLGPCKTDAQTYTSNWTFDKLLDYLDIIIITVCVCLCAGRFIGASVWRRFGRVCRSSFSVLRPWHTHALLGWKGHTTHTLYSMSSQKTLRQFVWCYTFISFTQNQHLRVYGSHLCALGWREHPVLRVEHWETLHQLPDGAQVPVATERTRYDS